MTRKPIIDPEEILKIFNKAIMEPNKLPKLTSVYIDKDGKLKSTKTKTKRVK